jgi:hypothetical protein
VRKILTFVGAATALALAASAAAGLIGSASTDVTKLIPKATKIVRAKATFKKAVLLEGDGKPATKGKKVTTAAGITNWRFVYNNQGTKGSQFKSLFINYSNGQFGNPVGNKSPFLEDIQITKVPKMTLTQAVAKLRAAGHKAPFGAVTLRYPLGPGFTETLYIFSLGSGQYWSVGTKSGKVKPIQ